MKKCRFCDFVKGEITKHRNGFPVIFLNKSRHSVSFLSIDFPTKEDGHILIVPKKHFESVTQIPRPALHNLMDAIALAVKVLKTSHAGCNVLLNDGKAAGQYEPHIHFHVIPRDKNDGVVIESWQRKNLSLGEFIKLSDSLKRKFSRP